MPKHWDIPGNEQKPEWMQSEERSTEDAKQRNNVGAIQNSPNNTTCATAAYVSEGGDIHEHQQVHRYGIKKRSPSPKRAHEWRKLRYIIQGEGQEAHWSVWQHVEGVKFPCRC